MATTRLEEIGKRLVLIEHEKRLLLAEWKTLQSQRVGLDVQVQHCPKGRVSQTRAKQDFFTKLGF